MLLMQKKPPMGKPMGEFLSADRIAVLLAADICNTNTNPMKQTVVLRSLNLSCCDLSSYSALHNHPACFHRVFHYIEVYPANTEKPVTKLLPALRPGLRQPRQSSVQRATCPPDSSAVKRSAT